MVETVLDVAFLENTSARLACVLVLDGSGNMAGSFVRELNLGLQEFEKDLKQNDLASLRVQLLVIRFGGEVEILTDWTDAMDFEAPTIRAAGDAPLGKAVDLALSKLEEQKLRYRAHGIPYYRPWLFLITNSSPIDHWESSALKCRKAEQDGHLVVYGIGVDGANMNSLGQFSIHPPVELQRVKFRDLFVWASKSVAACWSTRRGGTMQLASPPDWSGGSTFRVD